MKAIDCNTNLAYTLLMRERDALAVRPKNVNELWRVRFNDAIAVAYKGKVLAQGENPERINNLLKHAGEAIW